MSTSNNSFQQVTMNNSMISLVHKDPELIANMKKIIDKQQAQIDKKTMILQAIQNNIDYLTHMHAQGMIEVEETREQYVKIMSENMKLVDRNKLLQSENDRLQKDSETLFKEQQRIGLLIQQQESQRSAIDTLKNEIDMKNDRVQKLDFNYQVVFTEKEVFRKDLENQDELIRDLKKQLYELQLKYDLVTDENSKVQIQNAEYRDLIIGNENKMKLYREEIQDAQKKIEIKEAYITKQKDEIYQHKLQVEGLVKQLKEALTEKQALIEENRKMMIGESLVVTDEELKLKFQTMQNEYEFKRNEWVANEERYMSQLNFSKEANENLKKDFDLLQEKFENYMRTNNQINANIQDELDDMHQKNKILRFQLDDINSEMQSKIDQAMEGAIEMRRKANEEVEQKDKQVKQAKSELEQLKGEINLKLTKLKIQEMEMYRMNQKSPLVSDNQTSKEEASIIQSEVEIEVAEDEEEEQLPKEEVTQQTIDESGDKQQAIE